MNFIKTILANAQRAIFKLGSQYNLKLKMFDKKFASLHLTLKVY